MQDYNSSYVWIIEVNPREKSYSYLIVGESSLFNKICILILKISYEELSNKIELYRNISHFCSDQRARKQNNKRNLHYA